MATIDIIKTELNIQTDLDGGGKIGADQVRVMLEVEAARHLADARLDVRIHAFRAFRERIFQRLVTVDETREPHFLDPLLAVDGLRHPLLRDRHVPR